jgi:hypothetical protein
MKGAHMLNMVRRAKAIRAIKQEMRDKMLTAIKDNARDSSKQRYVTIAPVENATFVSLRDGTEQDLFEYMAFNEIKRD